MSIGPRLPYPYDKLAAGARVITMSKRAMTMIRGIEVATSEARLLVQAAEKEARIGGQIARDELKLAGGGRPAAMQLPKAPPRPGAPPPPRPGGAAPLASAAAKIEKELAALRHDFADAVRYAEQQRHNQKAWKLVRRKLAFNAAYNKLLAAQHKFNNAYASMLKNPGVGQGQLAAARRELEGAFNDLSAAMG